ncbi:glycosyltransferase family 2 protein [Buttiauxella izardii]|uniref:Glycosyltransferase n=1 Tax=Buttiauxella izardii TaxID=82991 RepID=A0A3A5K1B3_9ENTR|nr:glycosyltransferase [Buttiauxella izardii]RJT25986.1 glycosyltransferase [Buttiauxella izardii]
MPKVSVIMPVYNAEQYVERAITSLLEQTLDDVQFIIIDDGSEDNSLAIINQVIACYPGKRNNVILISRENRGVAATRAEGMTLATGDYIIHLDSDDWAEDNWLETMHTKSIAENADVVICDYTEVYSTRNIHVKQPIAINGVDCVRKLLSGELHGSTWNKLVKRKLYVDNNFGFYPGVNYLEDFILIMQVFFAAQIISYIESPLVYYNKMNEHSITAIINEERVKEIISATDVISSILKKFELYGCLSKQFAFFKLNQKSWILYCNRNNIPTSLWDIFQGTNDFIWRSPLPIYNKIILYAGALRQFFVARMMLVFIHSLRKIIR